MVKCLLRKFTPRNEKGEAVETLDEAFGFPKTFLITLTNEERMFVYEVLKDYRNDNREKSEN